MAILVVRLLGEELPLESAELGAVHVPGVVACGYLIRTQYALLVLLGFFVVLVEAWLAYRGVVEVVVELVVVLRALCVRATLPSTQLIHHSALSAPAS